MCAGGQTMAAPSPSASEAWAARDMAPGTPGEVRWLREQHASMERQLRSQELCLKELRAELAQRGDEEMAHRVARHARASAASVLRHEEELRRVAARYEEQLLTCPQKSPSLPSKSFPKAVDTLFRRDVCKASPSYDSLPVPYQRLTSDGNEARLRQAEAEAARYKKQARKLKKDRRSASDRFQGYVKAAVARESVAGARSALLLWRCVARQASLARQTAAAPATASIPPCAASATASKKQQPTPAVEAAVPSQRAGASARSLEAARYLAVSRSRLSVLAAVLRAWVVTAAAARYEAELRAQVDEVSMKSMSALATLRAEQKALRARGRRAGGVAALGQALLSLAAPFGAWAREVAKSRGPRMRPSDIVLNSGEAARRAQCQLEEMRGQLDDANARLAALGLEAAGAREAAAAAAAREYRSREVAADAATQEARMARLATRLEAMVHAANTASILLVALRAWAAAADVDAAVPTGGGLPGASAQAPPRPSGQHPMHLHIGHELQGQAAATRVPGHLLQTVSPSFSRRPAARDDVAKESARVRSLLLQCVSPMVSRPRAAPDDVAQEAWTSSLAGCREEVARRERDAGFLFVALKAWAGAAVANRHARALQEVRSEAHRRLADDEQRHKVALECARTESSTALHQAWSESTTAARRMAALQRQEQLLQEHLRPATAGAFEKPRPVLAWMSKGSLLETMVAREAHRCHTLMLQAWRRVAAEAARARELGRARVDALEQLMIAREGRKGIFKAAIAQQVRRWMASAFGEWRCAVLEAARGPRPGRTAASGEPTMHLDPGCIGQAGVGGSKTPHMPPWQGVSPCGSQSLIGTS
mmetsp:Transcript_8174/g.20531  ORF Transcript_8174/g.20531 Transcript_8174/m.20531 type:complete len:829 (+) Transcript_8174:62-2548(+)